MHLSDINMSPSTKLILRELQKGQPLSKFDLELRVNINTRNVNVHLKRLHDAKLVHICNYIRLTPTGVPTKLWAYGKSKDVAPPKAMTWVEKRRKRRLDPEVCIQEMMKKRAIRHQQRMEKLRNDAASR